MLVTIISIVATAIISIFIAKWQMKKNKIVHFTINSYDIGKGLSDEFPEFKLHFGDEVLADNVMVLKGGFMNVGRNDVTGLKGENDIKLILPDGCKVKAVTISPSTDDLKVDANKDNNKENILNFGIAEILKTDEYFKYMVIVEASNDVKSLHSMLKFSHRLSNTDKIKNTYIGLQRNMFRKRFYKMMISFMVLMTLFVITFFSYQNLRYNIYKKVNNQEVKIHIDPYSNLYVNEGLSIPFISGNKISLDELKNEYKIVPITEFRLSSIESVMAIFLLLLSLVYILLAYYIAWGRNGHIVNVLKENEES